LKAAGNKYKALLLITSLTNYFLLLAQFIKQ